MALSEKNVLIFICFVLYNLKKQELHSKRIPIPFIIEIVYLLVDYKRKYNMSQ